ncbi:hypothetical protein Pla100_10020 [Neorhodopirellula pilleata]|uniref:BlaR1 peptidase M56 n=1 Tax=Neorhodopirellula pilleata TaxID=2714738 RepID=A0A5C6AYK5_9BACT|nr:hypothetical protein Pla100_10020 [Neorhodopirellula pilleata]
MSQLSVDWSELSLQGMLTFGHFLWQGCLVALVLTIVERLSSIVLRSSSSRRYTLACLAFFALPICVASTFAWVHKSRGPVLLVAGSPVESPATPVASVSEPIPQDNRADVPMLPAPALPAEPESPVARPLETPSLSVTSVSWTQQIQSYAPSLLIAYAIGVLLMLGRFGLSVVGSSRIRRTVQPNTDSRLLKIVTQQSARMGLGKRPNGSGVFVD